MSGHIRRRGERSFELKFSLGRDLVTGKRKTHTSSFKGTKRKASAELTRLMASATGGDYVNPTKITVAEFFGRWLVDWAGTNTTPKTAEGYALTVKSYIDPHLGALPLQRLDPITLNTLYGTLLREGGRDGHKLAPRSVSNVHRLIHAALAHAVKWRLIVRNPADDVHPPRVESPEVEILDAAGIAALFNRLHGKSLYIVATLGLATGMRRGEMLATRWQDIDFAAGKIRVERSLEQSKAGGLRFKSTKTRAGKRTIAIPPSVVAELRRYRLEQLERWLALGLGKIRDDSLVLATWTGGIRSPNSLSRNWHEKVPEVSLHALRHTHASQLISAGMDVVTVARRLGHSKTSTTLNVYSHLYSNTDEQAATIIEATFAHLRD